MLPGTVAGDVRVKLERDGGLSVVERITVPDGTPVRRTVALRQSASENSDRVFTVSDTHVEGSGTAKVEDDQLAITLQPGVSTVRYTVSGAVADVSDGQEVRWEVSGGWDLPVDRVQVSFLAPKQATGISCMAGVQGTTAECDQGQINHTGAVRATQFGLKPGERMDLSVQLPAGTVAPNAQFAETFSVARAFSLSPVSGAGLAGVGMLLVGGFGLLWYTRGRDVSALASEVGPVEVLLSEPEGGVTFASPDGVLPGQIGTVIDEHVDVVDITATVVDLAVRNYLWIEELPGAQQARDWRIVRLNEPDQALQPYERAVYELLLGGESTRRGEVLLSQLRGEQALDLTQVRDALYTDVVDKHWFSRRPDSERNLFWWGGVGLALAGAALTAVLAFTTSLALLGIGVTLGGIALTFGARLMPARTNRGSALVAQMRGLRNYLHTATADSLPETDREMVFSRSLPYAVVLGETERWLAEFAELDPGADGTPGLYWYGEFVEDAGHVVPNLRRFSSHFPLLLLAMDGVLAQAGHLRTLK